MRAVPDRELLQEGRAERPTGQRPVRVAVVEERVHGRPWPHRVQDVDDALRATVYGEVFVGKPELHLSGRPSLPVIAKPPRDDPRDERGQDALTAPA